MEHNITGALGNEIIVDASFLDTPLVSRPLPLKKPEMGFERFDGIDWTPCSEAYVDSSCAIWRHRGEVGAKYRTTERKVIEYERVEEE